MLSRGGSHGRGVGGAEAVAAHEQQSVRPMAGPPPGDQRDHSPAQHRLPVAHAARAFRPVANGPEAASAVVGRRHLGTAAPARPGRRGCCGRHQLGYQHRLHIDPRSSTCRRGPEGAATVPSRHLKGGRTKISSRARAHAPESVPGGGGAPGEALGRSRGGLTTKIHLAADGRCRPLSLLLTPGQRADCTQFEPVMDKIHVPRLGPGRSRRAPDSVAADKAYSNSKIRAQGHVVQVTCPG